MLRAITDDDCPPPAAYRVPWRVERLRGPHPIVINEGAAAADFVRVFVATSRPLRDLADTSPDVDTLHWGQMLPGESAELCLCACDPDSVSATIAWFRPDDGTEYVWRFTP